MTPLTDTSRLTASLVDLGRRCLGARQLNHLVRFEPVLTLVLELSNNGGTMLDVGSGSRGIASLLPAHWRATAVDANFDDYIPGSAPRQLAANQQFGDVRALPFRDASFDVAVAVDLLEHVPPDDRAQAVREICRVTRQRAVIACPMGDDALAADRRLASWFEQVGREIPGWLVEHLQNGFPESADITDAATPYGRTWILGNESMSAHQRLVIAEHRPLSAVVLRLACRPLERMLASRRSRARATAGRILRQVRGLDRAPTYRGIVVVDRSAVG